MAKSFISWSVMTAEGECLGRWKDRLDRRFIARHLGTQS